MFFKMTDFTLLTIGIGFFFACLHSLIWSGATWDKNARIVKAICGWLLVFILILMTGYDQRRVKRSHDFSIPATELSNTEMYYRSIELEKRKKRADTAKELDELTDELDLVEQKNVF